MLDNKYKQITISEHISLYDKIIPQDHFLRKLKENIDFSFVNKLVEKEYCKENGRPAKEPELMYKLLFLQTKDLLSDREVIERAKTDMAYKYFLDLNPEDELPSYSLLSVFRNTKIKDEKILEEMLRETVRQAIEKGIVKSNSIIVDATHTNSKNEKKTPTQVLRELSKNLRKEIQSAVDKDAETKIAHGLDKAKSMGLSRMRIQSYLAHITANLKRIIKIMDEVPA